MTDGTGPGIIAGREAERTWTSRVRALFLRHEWLRGYALLSPTLLVMVCLLALPIFTGFGDVAAAISVTGPLDRMTADALDQFAIDVIAAANLVTAAIGCDERPDHRESRRPR